MKFNISKDRKTLTIFASGTDRKELRKTANIQTDKALYEFFEPLVCNSELQWINPANTGDLTDAPMLGITDESGKMVIERWAFMDYQIRSPLEDLRDNGKVVFIS